ncbi:MAG: DUF4867 family protein [Treponema sp.]|nr:DUF4867 family protein [Treponema sp.]
MDIQHLNAVNSFKVFALSDAEFKTYGRIVEGYDFSQLLDYMEENTSIPEQGNVYVPSVPEMEAAEICPLVKNILYGGMDIQIGYCNGRNSTFNGFEYHKGSEINIAVTDFCLCLGHSWDIQDNTYDVENVQVFFVPKGTAIEMYQTTLHLSPCKTSDTGFKGIVILPKGTNTPLPIQSKDSVGVDKEGKLLLQKNKWVIAHPEREPLIKQGAVAGVIGPNKEVKY